MFDFGVTLLKKESERIADTFDSAVTYGLFESKSVLCFSFVLMSHKHQYKMETSVFALYWLHRFSVSTHHCSTSALTRFKTSVQL